MKKNIGDKDKWIRIFLGLILIVLLFVIQSGWRWIGLIGLVLLVTAFMGYCPSYALFGINTNRDDKEKAR